MFIHETIFNLTIDEAKKRTITDVRIGLGYTLVELDGSIAGLSYSFYSQLNLKNCTVLKEAGELTGKRADFLLEKIFSYNLLDSTLALATANAIINSKEIKDENIDIVSIITKSDKVVMVGYFSPLIEPIKSRAGQFVVCDRTPREESLPDYAEYFELKDADIVILTATSIINKTIDNLLEMIKKAKVIAIMGPSTPMSCSIFNRNIYLMGSIITDIPKAKEIISQSGGTQKLKPAVKKISVKCERREK
ncbi:DUF364 domain-containing protein [Hippea alviniae]|uniref:DUF364 domain-containing protein n=1 Tax=Hippea alviniae TaxID=1279027 RepID=UPI0003B66B99|nr:DUF364 domain-containing protein [Hippea alviniae]